MQKIGDIPNTRADNNGEFTDGNVAGGVPPTILPAEWFNTLQRELMSVLSAAEIDADSAQFNQVAAAISKLISNEIEGSHFLQAANHLKEIKSDFVQSKNYFKAYIADWKSQQSADYVQLQENRLLKQEKFYVDLLCHASTNQKKYLLIEVTTVLDDFIEVFKKK